LVWDCKDTAHNNARPVETQSDVFEGAIMVQVTTVGVKGNEDSVAQ
jgi:hypothetical protein